MVDDGAYQSEEVLDFALTQAADLQGLNDIEFRTTVDVDGFFTAFKIEEAGNVIRCNTQLYKEIQRCQFRAAANIRKHMLDQGFITAQDGLLGFGIGKVNTNFSDVFDVIIVAKYAGNRHKKWDPASSAAYQHYYTRALSFVCNKNGATHPGCTDILRPVSDAQRPVTDTSPGSRAARLICICYWLSKVIPSADIDGLYVYMKAVGMKSKLVFDNYLGVSTVLQSINDLINLECVPDAHFDICMNLIATCRENEHEKVSASLKCMVSYLSCSFHCFGMRGSMLIGSLWMRFGANSIHSSWLPVSVICIPTDRMGQSLSATSIAA